MTELKPGDRLDQYVLDSQVAVSGMATVFRAHDAETGAVVAIKVPHANVESDPVLFDRFEREREIGQRIDHPGVMKVIANPERTRVYMVMEWLDGRLLRTILSEQPRVPPERALALTREIAAALGGHSCGRCGAS